IPARRHPLRLYAALELGIGAIALLVLYGMPLVGRVYAASAGTAGAGLLLRGVVAALCLLPPTVLMGATLPALSRWVETTPRGASWLGSFYAGNTVGAVFGSLLAGFYLLRLHDMQTATWVAVALNLAVAAAAWTVARVTPPAPEPPPPGRAVVVAGARWIYVATALSGMAALAAEVVWTRLLSLLFGGTTYAFSLILAAFLVGIGLGSGLGSVVGRVMERPRAAFGWCQALLCVAIAWGAYMLTDSLPYWPIDPSLAPSPWLNFHLDFARSLWAVLPAALLWGASFPLALAALVGRDQDPARLLGGLYAANTVGAIIGALGANIIIAAHGSQVAQQALVGIAALAALLVLAQPLLQAAMKTTGGALKFAGTLALIGVVAGSVAARVIHPVPGSLVAYGRWAPTRAAGVEVIYMGEGLNSSVAVSRLSNGVLNYHNAGKVQASSEVQDMRLQRMLGHLTTLLPASPKSVLVIGCGAGITAGAVSVDPAVERLTIAEIEPLVVRTVGTYFAAHNFNVLGNPKTHPHIDDARHFLLTTRETFDAITSDPLDPWVKGAAMLYSREFFELVKRRLNPGGVVTLFVQLYESSEQAVKSEIATFFEAFPNGAIFANTLEGAGYDLVLVGQVEPLRIDLDAIEARLRRPEYATLARSLSEIGFRSSIDLFATYGGRPRDMAAWLQDAQITRDLDLRLQYLAGLGLNLRAAGSIYEGMLVHRRFPSDMFVGSEAARAWLLQAMMGEARW
ncbi:MAG: SAM-dependent methyltransferase, partial [Acidobacteria bacterium]